MNDNNQWFKWANELQSIAQAGLTFCKDEFDIDRFKKIQKIACEILTHQSFESFEKINEMLTNEKHYLTPKLDVRTAIIQNDKILLVRERMDGKWSLPGGFADVNESPSESAKKEVLEETGYEVDIKKLYAFIDKRKRQYPHQLPYTYKCFFLGDIIKGEPKANLEISDISFFERTKLPELSQHRVQAEQIHLAFKHYGRIDLPTEYD